MREGGRRGRAASGLQWHMTFKVSAAEYRDTEEMRREEQLMKRFIFLPQLRQQNHALKFRRSLKSLTVERDPI